MRWVRCRRKRIAGSLWGLEAVYPGGWQLCILSPDVEANAQNISLPAMSWGRVLRRMWRISAALSALMYKIPAGGSVTVAKADGTDIDATAYASLADDGAQGRL